MLIKNVNIVDSNKTLKGDVFIENGKIVDFGEDLQFESENIIDGKNLTLMPSFIDLHCHFRDPGLTYKEDLETGSKAALKGGYTFVNLMANTKPIVSSMETVNYVLEKSRNLDLVNIHQTVSITENFDGKTISHLDTLSSDVKCISDDGMGVLSNKVMYDAMNKSKEKDFVLISHPEDKYISKIDDRLSENMMTLRDLSLCQATGCHLHVAHISTKEIADYIRYFKKNNTNVTCEVAPHHFALYDNEYKVNPPIRTKEDVLALIEAIKDGTIDVIATDHAPHTAEDKLKGSPGISGLETGFCVSFTSLVKQNAISLNKLSSLMSKRPAEILKLNKGLIEKGYDADLVLVDLDKEITIDSNKFKSKGKNTPFNGMKYFGDVVCTIRDGIIKYNALEVQNDR